MSGSEQIRARLRSLIKQGSLPASACGRAFLSFVEPLIAADLIRLQRAGAGRSLRVQNVEAIKAWIHDRFPSDSSDSASSRIASVAQFRDTKVLPSDAAPTVQVRCWSDSALLREGLPVGAAAATAGHGVFTFILEPASAYEITAGCAVIENPEVFRRFEDMRLVERIPLALYAGGRISRRLLAWLTKQNAPAFQVTHFPDYDPVGLSEFVRLRDALGPRAALHMPADLDLAFRNFSNRELLRNKSSQALLAKLRSNTLPEVRAVVRLIDICNAGLEQEALLT